MFFEEGNETSAGVYCRIRIITCSRITCSSAARPGVTLGEVRRELVAARLNHCLAEGDLYLDLRVRRNSCFIDKLDEGTHADASKMSRATPTVSLEQHFLDRRSVELLP